MLATPSHVAVVGGFLRSSRKTGIKTGKGPAGPVRLALMSESEPPSPPLPPLPLGPPSARAKAHRKRPSSSQPVAPPRTPPGLGGGMEGPETRADFSPPSARRHHQGMVTRTRRLGLGWRAPKPEQTSARLGGLGSGLALRSRIWRLAVWKGTGDMQPRSSRRFGTARMPSRGLTVRLPLAAVGRILPPSLGWDPSPPAEVTATQEIRTPRGPDDDSDGGNGCGAAAAWAPARRRPGPRREGHRRRPWPGDSERHGDSERRGDSDSGRVRLGRGWKWDRGVRVVLRDESGPRGPGHGPVPTRGGRAGLGSFKLLAGLLRAGLRSGQKAGGWSGIGGVPVVWPGMPFPLVI